MNEHKQEIGTEFDSMKVVLSNNIKKFRKSRRMSQQTLADMCGLHRTYISDLENAKCNPTLGVMFSLSGSLGVGLEDLLGFTNAR